MRGIDPTPNVIEAALKKLQDAVEKRTCKTLWETFKEVQDSHGVDRFALSLLDDMKDALTEALPYGPDEVY